MSYEEKNRKFVKRGFFDEIESIIENNKEIQSLNLGYRNKKCRAIVALCKLKKRLNKSKKNAEKN